MLRLLTLALCLSSAAQADTIKLAQDPQLRAAARQVLTGLQSRSFQTGREYCGLLGRDDTGAIIATRAQRGNIDDCQPNGFSRSDVTPLASYHTHAAYDIEADSEVPSFEDLSADRDEGLIGFVATPGGRLWVTVPEAGEAWQLCGLRCLPQDRFFQQGDWGFIRNRYTLRELKQRKQLY